MTDQVNQVSDCCPRCGAELVLVTSGIGNRKYFCGTVVGGPGFALPGILYDTDECKLRTIPILAAERDELKAEVESAKACLTAYEQWEAAVIMSDEAWGGGMAPLPTITQELWDRLFEIQVMRNKVLHTTPTPKGEA